MKTRSLFKTKEFDPWTNKWPVVHLNINAFSIFVAPEGNQYDKYLFRRGRRLFRLASEKNRAGFIVFSFALIFSVFSAVSGQEEDRSAEIDQKLELLYGRVVKNQNALDGLSNGIRSTKNKASENAFAIGAQSDLLAETRQIMDGYQENLSAIQADLVSNQEMLSGLMQEQEELRQEIQSSLGQIKTAYMVAVGSAVITLILALVLARSVVNKNKLNWYSLVRDAMNTQQ